MNEEEKENNLNENIDDSKSDGETQIEEKNHLDDKETETNELKSDSKDNKEEEKIDEVKIELESTKDKLLRVLAENENIRKQSEKIKIDAAKYGVQPLARELINVLDNFERAINSAQDASEEKTLEGFKLIQKDTLQILEMFNVKKIDALGSSFDANLHQAMFEKPSKDYEAGTVCEIVQEGYMFHDRLLRPAMVGIAKKNENQDNQKNIDKEKNVESHQQNEHE